MRMSFKSVAMAVAIVTAGFTAAPATAQGFSQSDVVMVRDGYRSDRAERRHHRAERRYHRAERRHHRAERRYYRDRYYDGRRHSRYSRHDRERRYDRRHHRGNGFVIRLN
jgi:hypothetical protein